MTCILTILAASGGIWAENTIVDNRYPIETEFALVSSCLDNDLSEKAVNQAELERTALEICTCAVQSAMNDAPDLDTQENQNIFKESFSNQILSCQKERSWF